METEISSSSFLSFFLFLLYFFIETDAESQKMSLSDFFGGLVRHPATIAYCVAFVLIGIGIAILGPTLDHLAVQTDSELNDVAFLFPSRSVGYVLGSIVGGRLFDKFPGHRLLFIVLTLTAVAVALIPLLNKVWMIGLVLIVQGGAMGFLDTGGNVMIILLHREKVAPYMQLMHTAFGVGAFVSPLLVQQMVTLAGGPEGTKYAYWLLAACILPCALWFLCLKSPSQRKEGAHKKAESSRREWSVVLLTGALLGLYVGNEVTYGGYIVTYSHHYMELSESQSDFINSIFWGFLALGRCCAVVFTYFISAQALLLIDLAMCGVAMALLSLFPHSVWLLWVASAVYGFFMGPVFPGAINLAEEMIDVSGTFAAFFVTGAAIGEMILPVILASIFVQGFHQLVWLTRVSMIVALLSTIVLYFLFKVGTQTEKWKHHKDKKVTDVSADRTEHSPATEVELTERDDQGLIENADSD